MASIVHDLAIHQPNAGRHRRHAQTVVGERGDRAGDVRAVVAAVVDGGGGREVLLQHHLAGQVGVGAVNAAVEDRHFHAAPGRGAPDLIRADPGDPPGIRGVRVVGGLWQPRRDRKRLLDADLGNASLAAQPNDRARGIAA